MTTEPNKEHLETPDQPGCAKNPYSYAAGARVADFLESTQLNKFGTKGGTGFAAEDANALHEKLQGIDVQQVGTSNEKNGADRLANGVPIQTKYFDSASRTVNDAFDNSTGNFRYGGMQLEVPEDQYDQAVAIMREKIAAGKVPDVTNPDDATTIIKKGNVTYQQARNIARAGNIDSLTYDAKNNAVSSSYAFAIGFMINYARATWDGKSAKEALTESAALGLHSAGTSFFAGVVTSQLLRTQSARMGTVVMREGVKAACKTELGKSVVSKIASASAGKALYGAAATNHVAKLLRTNVITSAVTTIVITSPDIYRAAMDKNTSWAQVGKNLVVNGAGVAAGAAGWMGGAAAGATIGTAIFPGVGTTVGTIVGGLLGSISAGSAGSYISKKTMDYLVDDDSKEMLDLITQQVPLIADEFMLLKAEFDEFVDGISKVCTPEFLREMYGLGSKDARIAHIRGKFEIDCRIIINRRPHITPPSADLVDSLVRELLVDSNADDENVPHAPESASEAGVDEPTDRMSNEPYVPNFIIPGMKPISLEAFAVESRFFSSSSKK